MQVPGPALVVVPIIVCSAAAGWALMRIRRRDSAREDALLDRATITLTFVGTWAAISLLYYMNRAFAAGQLQTMLLPCGVCVATLLAVAMRTDEFGTLWHAKAGSMWAAWTDKARLLPIGVFVGLCFSSLLLTTDPVAATRSLAPLRPLTATRHPSYLS